MRKTASVRTGETSVAQRIFFAEIRALASTVFIRHLRGLTKSSPPVTPVPRDCRVREILDRRAGLFGFLSAALPNHRPYHDPPNPALAPHSCSRSAIIPVDAPVRFRLMLSLLAGDKGLSSARSKH
jgi:hypothetical protein